MSQTVMPVKGSLETKADHSRRTCAPSGTSNVRVLSPDSTSKNPRTSSLASLSVSSPHAANVRLLIQHIG